MCSPRCKIVQSKNKIITTFCHRMSKFKAKVYRTRFLLWIPNPLGGAYSTPQTSYLDLRCSLLRGWSQWRRLHWARGARAPTFKTAGHEGHLDQKNSKQETDQTVLTVTKVLTKTTNCTFRAKKVEGRDQKNFRRFAPDRCPPLSNSFRRHWIELKRNERERKGWKGVAR